MDRCPKEPPADADPDPARNADHRHPESARHQGLRQRLEQTRGSFGGDRASTCRPSRNAECFCGAGDRWLFLDVKVNRQEASRFGLSVQDVNEVVMTAIGGMNVSETVEGRERYPIQVRYAREFRDHPEALKRVLVATPTGIQVPLPQVANVEFVTGPPMIRSEDGQLVNSDGKHVARAASRSANLSDRCEPGTCYSITPSCFMNESMSK